VGSKYIFREFAKLENIIINLSDQQTCGTWFQRRTEQRPKEKIKHLTGSAWSHHGSTATLFLTAKLDTVSLWKGLNLLQNQPFLCGILT